MSRGKKDQNISLCIKNQSLRIHTAPLEILPSVSAVLVPKTPGKPEHWRKRCSWYPDLSSCSANLRFWGDDFIFRKSSKREDSPFTTSPKKNSWHKTQNTTHTDLFNHWKIFKLHFPRWAPTLFSSDPSKCRGLALGNIWGTSLQGKR